MASADALPSWPLAVVPRAATAAEALPAWPFPVIPREARSTALPSVLELAVGTAFSTQHACGSNTPARYGDYGAFDVGYQAPSPCMCLYDLAVQCPAGAPPGFDGHGMDFSAWITASAPLEETRSQSSTASRKQRKPRRKQVPEYDPDLLSRGSKNHESGMCRPCTAIVTPEGCPKGRMCNYCHCDHDKNKLIDSLLYSVDRELRKSAQRLQQPAKVPSDACDSPELGSTEVGSSPGETMSMQEISDSDLPQDELQPMYVPLPTLQRLRSGKTAMFPPAC